MKHAHSKLKKLLQDKTAELDHATSRADQYEQEVRKLRSRIDELKRDLANAEDEVRTSVSQFVLLWPYRLDNINSESEGIQH